MSDAKEAAENAAADKLVRSVEADTFRGVHLDPNAHHWDEVGFVLSHSIELHALSQRCFIDGGRR